MQTEEKESTYFAEADIRLHCVLMGVIGKNGFLLFFRPAFFQKDLANDMRGCLLCFILLKTHGEVQCELAAHAVRNMSATQTLLIRCNRALNSLKLLLGDVLGDESDGPSRRKLFQGRGHPQE